jgi:hypothetical protein
MIDGSVHPEMIQDREAFRLFFLAAATDANPMPEEKERQRAMLSSAGFSEKELAVSSTVLADYKRQYEAAIQQYNDAVASARSPEQFSRWQKVGCRTRCTDTGSQSKAGVLYFRKQLPQFVRSCTG